MENSPFAKLSREIRDQITELALTLPGREAFFFADDFTQHDEHVNACRTARSGFNTCVHTVLNGWPVTCKQAREESGTIFFLRNKFSFLNTDEERVLEVSVPGVAMARHARSVLTQITPTNAKAIRHLHLAVKLHGNDHFETRRLWDHLRKTKALIHPEATMTVFMMFHFVEDPGPIPTGHHSLYTALYPVWFDVEFHWGDVTGNLARIKRAVKHAYHRHVEGRSKDLRALYENFGTEMSHFIHGFGDEAD